jgi:hypothetical protein
VLTSGLQLACRNVNRQTCKELQKITCKKLNVNRKKISGALALNWGGGSRKRVVRRNMCSKRRASRDTVMPGTGTTWAQPLHTDAT